MSNIVEKLRKNNIVEINVTKNGEEKFVYAKRNGKWYPAIWYDTKHLEIEDEEIPNESLMSAIKGAKERGLPVYSYPVNTLKGFKRML